LSLIVGAGLKNDKPFTDQVTREAVKQHMSLSFVNYVREQAETARTVRVEACLKDMVDRKNASRVTPMSAAVEKAFRDKNYLLAVFMIDSHIEDVRRRFAETIDKDGGGSLNKSEWVADPFFQLETLEYFKDPRWVAELKKMRRFESASWVSSGREQRVYRALGELRANDGDFVPFGKACEGARSFGEGAALD
jgi:hypothetical protein